jgi:uracil-DNA glycosylase family 4
MIKDYNLSDAWIQAMGVEDFKYSQKKPKSENPAIHKSEKMTQEIKQNSENKNMISRVLADKVNSLDELRRVVETFDGCDLKKGAKNTVFSDGIADSKIMLIGEAPGATEDEQGIPFCGESGKLLDNMLRTIGLTRDKNFYITNTIFWRPPANRTPTIDEIEICRPFVEKHIALIKPKLLILVGSTAVSSLLGANLQISKIRQEYYQYQNQYLDNPITTTALFHPAYLLRQPMQKKTTWYDLLRIKDYTIRI